METKYCENVYLLYVMFLHKIIDEAIDFLHKYFDKNIIKPETN